ncbi:MAG: class C sortase [Firmicutes bacterium]|nr:class C sortase [Bacillota bacterium]
MRKAALLLSALLFMYPYAADRINDARLGTVIKAYTEQAEGLSAEQAEEILNAAAGFNARLAAMPGASRWHLSGEDLEEYGSLMDLSGTGLIGRVSSGAIGLDLPFYHGTGEAVLQTAAGHLQGSSLPTGGDGEHAVITGHTGLTGARLFTDIDRLEAGDSFDIEVPGRRLRYEVERVSVVLPDEMDSLAIEEGECLATLVTCTPYGINSHRLLVTGRLKEILPAEEGGERVSTALIVRKGRLPGPTVMFAVGTALALWTLSGRAVRGTAAKQRKQGGSS